MSEKSDDQNPRYDYATMKKEVRLRVLQAVAGADNRYANREDEDGDNSYPSALFTALTQLAVIHATAEFRAVAATDDDIVEAILGGLADTAADMLGRLLEVNVVVATKDARYSSEGSTPSDQKSTHAKETTEAIIRRMTAEAARKDDDDGSIH